MRKRLTSPVEGKAAYVLQYCAVLSQVHTPHNVVFQNEATNQPGLLYGTPSSVSLVPIPSHDDFFNILF